MPTTQVPVYSLSGEKKGTQELAPGIFSIAFKDPLVHQVVRTQLANRRVALGHTKGRGEVRGGGRKPWRQKGTGRARHGSTRSPLWSGGGVTFGPTKERNFSLRLNKKMRKQALKMVLSDKVASDHFIVIEGWTMSKPKTKELGMVLGKLPSKSKKALLVTTPSDAQVIQAAKNLKKASTIGVGSLNVLDLLETEFVIVPQKLIATIEQRYK